MTGNDLNELYGAIIAPTASVSVPDAWLPAIHEALAALHDLPTEVRAFMIVFGIRAENGLVIEIGGVPDLMPPDGLKRIGEIVEKAQAAVQRSVH